MEVEQVPQPQEENKEQQVDQVSSSPLAVVPLTEAEQKKNDAFDAFSHIGEVRQRAFISTYKKMIEQKKLEESQMGKLKKVKRNFMKVVVGLIVLAMVYSKFQPVVY